MPSLKRVLSSKLFHLLLLSVTILYYLSLHTHQNLDNLRLQSEIFKKEWLRVDWRTQMRSYPAGDGRIHVSAPFVLPCRWLGECKGKSQEWLDSREEEERKGAWMKLMRKQYVGRWIETPNRLRKDGLFPGESVISKVRNRDCLLPRIFSKVYGARSAWLTMNLSLCSLLLALFG